MDSSDHKRPSGSGFQFVWFIRQFQHFISNCVIMGESFCVGCNEALINQLLATGLELLQICDKWNVQDHISAKGHVRKSVHGLHYGNGGDHARRQKVTTNAWSFRYDWSAAASVTMCTLPHALAISWGFPRF
jgi:hypothetical protein